MKKNTNRKRSQQRLKRKLKSGLSLTLMGGLAHQVGPQQSHATSDVSVNGGKLPADLTSIQPSYFHR